MCIDIPRCYIFHTTKIDLSNPRKNGTSPIPPLYCWNPYVPVSSSYPPEYLWQHTHTQSTKHSAYLLSFSLCISLSVSSMSRLEVLCFERVARLRAKSWKQRHPTVKHRHIHSTILTPHSTSIHLLLSSRTSLTIFSYGTYHCDRGRSFNYLHRLCHISTVLDPRQWWASPRSPVDHQGAALWLSVCHLTRCGSKVSPFQ